MSWDTKYRPLEFDEVIGQEGTLDILKRLISEDEVFEKSYIFAGPSGTGKTTIARILARAMLCDNVDEDGEPCNQCESCREIIEGSSSFSFVEMDAANHSGVDTIRQMVDEIDYYTLDGNDRRIYLIDECFTEDTQLITEDGLKSIKEIVSSEYDGKVLSYDEETKEKVWKNVTDWFDVGKKETLKLEFDNGVELIVTVDQEIYTHNRGWVEARNLTSEDDICETQISDHTLPVNEEGEVSCLCGCGDTLKPEDSRGRPRQFKEGHGGVLGSSPTGPRVNWEGRIEKWRENPPTCKCGCGEPIIRTEDQIKNGQTDVQYILGHNQRKSNVRKFTEIEKSVIYGTLLGDTSILRPHDTSLPRLSFNHSVNQKEYAFHKMEVLSRLSWYHQIVDSGGYKKESKIVSAHCSCLSILGEIEEVVKVGGVKTVTSDWISNLNNRSLTYWFMDDGSANFSNYTDSISSIRLHTQGFSEHENHLLADYLESLIDQEVRVVESGGYHHLYLPRASSESFLNIVSSYVPHSMNYKVRHGKINQ